MAGHVWMQHKVHHGKAQFAAGATELWAALGWEPCEPDTEPDPTAEPTPTDLVDAVAATAAPDEAPAKRPPPSRKPKADKAEHDVTGSEQDRG